MRKRYDDIIFGAIIIAFVVVCVLVGRTDAKEDKPGSVHVEAGEYTSQLNALTARVTKRLCARQLCGMYNYDKLTVGWFTLKRSGNTQA